MAYAYFITRCAEVASSPTSASLMLFSNFCMGLNEGRNEGSSVDLSVVT